MHGHMNVKRQLCRIKGLHPLGHPVTAAVPIKGTLRVIVRDATTILFVFGATAPPPSGLGPHHSRGF